MWSSVGKYATSFLATIGARWAKPDEPRTEVIAEEIVLPAFHESQFMPLNVANGSSPMAGAPAFPPAKRQNCSPGWGYCSAWGGCCPLGNGCCRTGRYCVEPGGVCCPTGVCPPGYNCCENNCHPTGTQCCSNGRYCEVGNICVRFFDDGHIGCCTDLSCTAYVENGRTSYASTITRFTTRPVPTTRTLPTVTRAQTRTYYYTITWTYYYYYWTYYISIRASVVTSSAYTTRTTLRVLATDSFNARLSFEAMTPTVTFSTPAAATSLASLEGITSFDPGFGPSSEPSSTTAVQPLTNIVDPFPVPPPGGGISGATTARGSGGWLPICLASVGLGIGIMAVWL